MQMPKPSAWTVYRQKLLGKLLTCWCTLAAAVQILRPHAPRILSVPTGLSFRESTRTIIHMTILCRRLTPLGIH
ncbi:hypothetical protein BDW74DRAFT_144328 [Aspergillus multicolor]|uniref:uncharacterized protein n=1 Tax=Aspergillus multicolor TaxID=41759 RepID=UPI003CCD6962